MGNNPYDDIAADLPDATPPAEAGAAAPEKNPYDDVVKNMDADDVGALHTALSQAPTVKSDDAAQAYSLSKKTGLDVDLVQRNLPAVQQQAMVQDNNPADIHKDTPATASWLSDPLHASMGQDAIPQMQGLEQTVKAIGTQTAVASDFMQAMKTINIVSSLQPEDTPLQNVGDKVMSVMGNLGASFGSLPVAIWNANQALNKMLGYQPYSDEQVAQYGKDISDNWLTLAGTDAQQFWSNPSLQAENAAKYGQLWKTDKNAAIAKFTDDLAGFLPYSLLLATGNPAVLGATAAASGAQTSSQELQAGSSPEAATAAGLTKSAIFVGTGDLSEALAPFLKGLGDSVGEKMAPGVLNSLLSGALQKGAGALSGALGMMGMEGGNTLTDYLTGNHPEAFDDFGPRMFAAAASGTVMHIPSAFEPAAHGLATDAAHADINKNVLTDLAAQYKESPLTKTSPAAAADHLETVLKGSPLESQLTPVQSFRKLFQDQGLDPLKAANDLGAGEAYTDALKTGSDFKISTAKLIAQSHDDPIYSKLIEHLKSGSNAEGQTSDQVQQAIKEMQAQAEPAIDGASRVGELVKSQMLAAGVSQREAETTGALYENRARVRADRRGDPDLGPRELMQDWPLTITREGKQVSIDPGQESPRMELAQQNQQLDPQQQAHDLFIDKQSGVLKDTALDALPPSAEFPMEAHVSVAGPKWANKSTAEGGGGGYEAGNTIIKNGAQALMEHHPLVARAGGDFRLRVRDQAHLDEILANANKSLPDAIKLGDKIVNGKAFKLTGAVGETSEEAHKAHTELKAAAEAAGNRAARGEMPAGAEKVSKGAEPVDPKNNKIDIPAELMALHEGMKPEDVVQAANYSAKNPEVLSKEGFDKTSPKNFIAHMDLKGIGKMSRDKGDAAIEAFQHEMLLRAKEEGIEVNFARKNDNSDEFFMKHDDGEKLKKLLVDAKRSLREANIKGTTPEGDAYEMKGIEFYAGIGGNHGEADEQAELDKHETNKVSGDAAAVPGGASGVDDNKRGASWEGVSAKLDNPGSEPVHETPQNSATRRQLKQQQELDLIIQSGGMTPVTDFVAGNGKLDHEAIKTTGNERAYPERTPGNRLFVRGGETPDRMVQKAIESGVLPAGSTESDLQDALRKEAVAKTNFVSKYGGGSAAAGEKLFKSTQAKGKEAGVLPFGSLEQNNKKARPLGSFTPTNEQSFIDLMKKSNPSTILHESWHRFYFEMAKDAAYVRGLDPAEMTPGQQGILKDMDTALKAVGAKSFETMTDAQHEKLARWGEAYFKDGVAPSNELKPVFDQFRSWLVDIYRGAKKLLLGPEYSEEMKGVMDRMLASDDAIKEAQSQQGGVEPFPGMTEPKYLEALQAAHAHAVDKVSEKAIAQWHAQRRVEWRTERDSKAAENLTEINQRPEYKALNLLEKGIGPDGKEVAVPIKLNRENPDGSKIDEESLKGLPDDIFAKVGEKAYMPDTVAKVLGYEDADALFKDIANRPSAEDLAQQDANAYMATMHGDIMTDGTMPTEALEAVHNDKRAQVLREEFKYIAENHLAAFKGMIRDVAMRAMAPDAVASAAAFVIGDKNAGDIKPTDYLRTENKMRKDSAKLFTQGDFRGSAEAKQREILNHELYKQASDAQEQIAKITRYMKKFDKTSSSSRMGKAGEEFIKSIDFIRGQNGFDAPVADGQDHLDKLISRMSKGGNPLLLADSVLDGSDPTTTKQTPYQHLMDAFNAVKEIEYAAGQENKLSKASKEATLEDIGRKVTDFVDKRFGDKFVDKGASQDLHPAGMDALMEGRRKGVAWMSRVMSILISADNNEANGPFFKELWVKGKQEPEDKEAAMRDLSNVALKKMFEVYSPQEMLNLDLRRHYVKELNQKFTKSDMIMAIANWGNEGNREYLKNGNKFTEAHIQAFAKFLEPRDLDLVDSMVKHLESFRPLIKKQLMERSGRELKFVEPSPFDLKLADGTTRHMDGGYWPIVPDPKRSTSDQIKENVKNLDDMLGDKYGQHMTEDGYTKERERTKSNRPLDLGMHVFANSINDVMHDLAYREPLMDLFKKVNDPTIKAAGIRAVGPEKWAELTPWMGRLAGGLDYDPSGAAPIYQAFRNNYTAVSLGLKLVVPIKHVSMESIALKELGPKYWAKGIASLANPMTFSENLAKVHALSSYLAHVEDAGDSNVHALADSNGLFHEPGFIAKTLENYGAGAAGSKAALLGLYLDKMKLGSMIATRWLDKRTRAMTWVGAFQKSMDGQIPGIETGAQKDAVNHADRVAMEIKGAGGAGDVPRMLTGSQAEKLLYMFFSMRNVSFNQEAKAIQQTGAAYRSGGILKAAPQAVAGLLFTAALPTMWNQITTHGWPAHKKDLEEMGANSLEAYPWVGDLAKALIKLANGEHFSDGGLNLPILESMMDGVETVDAARRKAGGKSVPAAEKKGVLNTAALVFGAPAPGVFKFVDGLMDPSPQSIPERVWRSTIGPRKR